MAVWVHAVAAIPQVACIFWIGLRTQGRIFEEQASLDAPALAVFLNVTIYRLFPLVMVCAVWILLVCSREISVTDIFRIGTIAEQIYLGYSLGESESIASGYSIAVFLTLVAATILLASVPFLQQKNLSVEFSKTDNSSDRKPAILEFAVIGVFFLVVVAVPALNLTARASRYVELVAQVPTAKYSVENAIRVVLRVPNEFSGEFTWSFLIGIGSCLLILFLGIPLVFNATRSIYWRFGLATATSLVAGLPGPLIGSTVLWLRNQSTSDFGREASRAAA